MNLRCKLQGHNPEKLGETDEFPTFSYHKCTRCGATGRRLESGATIKGTPSINWGYNDNQ